MNVKTFASNAAYRAYMTNNANAIMKDNQAFAEQNIRAAGTGTGIGTAGTATCNAVPPLLSLGASVLILAVPRPFGAREPSPYLGRG